ncbi:hypothetical protein ceV_344 [Chrysochromulina ericina virus CeV-01B]|uniref:Uncharacterized protein n=1 Tax=Chrysochromulina ericina virus CeV-01B TaxID=3070830 RepID=A0A0N9QJB1_9VIRU|nr:hypothetical protein ceV_344 [Chrysochromulina ericina virus]ALH23250.1 hypothetical protein ceV_344 [Chrysochromulina ericina virus CeV-01B]
MDNSIQLEINDKNIDNEINTNSQKNIKLNKTDLEVLQKKVNFFLPELLKEPEKKKVPLQQKPQPQLKQKQQLYTMPTIIQNKSVIQPMSQMRSRGMRGISMKML